MLNALLPLASGPDAGFAEPLARAAAAMARLDQALVGCPLLPALLYRTRLEAVRLQAAADGQLIDPWHLAAVLEGLRLRMDGALRIIDRCLIVEAARYALAQHQWLAAPDSTQEAEIQQAEAALEARGGEAWLLSAARGFHAWIEGGGARPPIRAALIRFWMKRKVLRAPVPLTGAKALSPETPWDFASWTRAFLNALADEAADGLELLAQLERAWLAARRAVAGRRRTSRAAAAVDILAASPIVSATSLAAGLDMAIKNAARLLDEFCAMGIAVEVTHRSKRRLFGLAGLAPLRDQVAPPRRPEPGRGRGRPRLVPIEEPEAPLPPLPPVSRMERRAIDYSDLERWMRHADEVIRHSRRVLDQVVVKGPSRQDNDEIGVPERARLMSAR
jgi:hypothetical protein